MSILRIIMGIVIIFGGIASGSLIWIGMEMLGLPGWTAISPVIVTAWLLGRWLERLTRPANVVPEHITRAEVLRQFKAPRAERPNALD